MNGKMKFLGGILLLAFGCNESSSLSESEKEAKPTELLAGADVFIISSMSGNRGHFCAS